MVARQDEDDDDDNKIDDEKDNKSDKSSQGGTETSQQNEDDYGGSSEESSSEEEPGGLIGLITNLSGGDEGSDVNALIGALSQVVSNLLGPGGIDITGIVASGTALLSSLLRGDENFGKVLGNIFGVAINGLAGDGGALENGQFFGQFLGKFISVLSADPDDENAPLQPDSFIINFANGIGEGSAKATEATEREGEEDKPDNQYKGSDSSGYIASITSAILQIATKASAGSSAGSSQGSVQGVTGLSSGSSSGLSGGSLSK